MQLVFLVLKLGIVADFEHRILLVHAVLLLDVEGVAGVLGDLDYLGVARFGSFHEEALYCGFEGVYRKGIL